MHKVASSPGHSQLFNVAQEKWEGLVSKTMCVMLPVERQTWEKSMSKVTKILSALVANSH